MTADANGGMVSISARRRKTAAARDARVVFGIA